MTPAEIIKSAAADGVKLALLPGGKIKARGADAAVDFWLPAIRQHKAGIVRTLTAESKSMANTTIGYRCPCGSISYLPRAFQWRDQRGGKHWGFSCLGCKTRYWMV